MAPEALLTRVSLDLRGVRPTLDELLLVESDPETLDELIDQFLVDERWPAQVRNWYAEVLLTRAETYPLGADAFGLDDSRAFLDSIGDETLRILSHVADHDLPWTTIVTADWTMANEALAEAWGLDYPDNADGWQQATYTDGRPAAGILATNSLWWRYDSTYSNANRKRAATASRVLLCHDYLTRPVQFDRTIDLSDEEAVAEALQTNPACVNCHVTLDPLASYFWGFYYHEKNNPYDASVYHPDRELMWRDVTGVAPGFFGEPGYSLADLAQQIAGDPAFPNCTVDQIYEALLRRPTTLADTGSLAHHREAFLQGGLTLRSLVRSVVTDPLYQAGFTDTEGAVPLKMATPDLLASQIEDLTGYRWTYDGADMLGSDTDGVRVLAGGTDGVTVTRSATSPNATSVLVQQRLAELAASHVVQADANLESEARTLLTEVDFNQTQPEALVSQIQQLHHRFFGHQVDADGEEVAAAIELWDALYVATQDIHAAWTGVVAALLRDPDLLFY